MDRAVYEERKAAEVAAYKAAAAGLVPMIDALAPMDPRRGPLGEAEAMLREAADSVAKLGDTLLVYSEPGFYADVIAPTRASEDGGQHARNGLEYVFSE